MLVNAALRLCRGAVLFIIITSVPGIITHRPTLWLSQPAFIPTRICHGLMVATLSYLLFADLSRTEQQPKPGFLACSLAAALTSWALWGSLNCYFLPLSHQLTSPTAGPPSLILAITFLSWGPLLYFEQLKTPRSRPRAILLQGAGLIAGGLVTLFALIISLGAIDDRRPADCVIVLGARVYRDGQMSLALSDRVEQGIRLYKAGLVNHMIMTGGREPNGQSEALVMAAAALKAGVPKGAVIVDEFGDNTRASAINCGEMARRRGFRSALIVSHYYHLARCKEAFQREGLRSYTVPAHMTRRLAKEPFFIAREGFAYLYYSFH
jgi:uncharacterized SAM-binding protein YcdF (DUF218 family)